MTEPISTKILTILAGALAGCLMGLLGAMFQDYRKRKGLHKRLNLYATEQHYNIAFVRVHNGYVLPLTRCWAYISLDYNEKSDIVSPPTGHQAHITPDNPLRLFEDRLCWSSFYPTSHPAQIDIYSGEHQSLMVFSFDPVSGLIGIYSETGNKPFRVFLRGDKIYKGTIKIVSKETEAKVFNIQINLKDSKFPLSVLKKRYCCLLSSS